MTKAITYLSAAKPFDCSNEDLIEHLKNVNHLANVNDG